MNKKHAFILTALVWGSVIFFACKKNQTEGEGVAPTYASEATSTGGNPNVTTTGSSTASTTTAGTTTSGTTTSGTTTSGSIGSCGFTFNGTNYAGTCSDNSGAACTGSDYEITSVKSTGESCEINFNTPCSSLPAPGVYNVAFIGTAANECTVSMVINSVTYIGGGGTLTVSMVGGKLVCSFSNITMTDMSSTFTASGTLTQP